MDTNACINNYNTYYKSQQLEVIQRTNNIHLYGGTGSVPKTISGCASVDTSITRCQYILRDGPSVRIRSKTVSTGGGPVVSDRASGTRDQTGKTD